MQNPGPADDGGKSTQADGVPESEASDQQSQIKIAAMLGETIRLLEDASKLKVGFIDGDQSSSDMPLSNVKDLATKLHEQTSTMINSCDASLAASADRNPIPNTSIHDQITLISRDPADRVGLVLTENQKLLLAEKGPCQPRLEKFPINEAIKKTGNQLSFCSNWYSEYPHLEHSLKKNRAYFLRALSMARVSAPTKLRRRGFSV